MRQLFVLLLLVSPNFTQNIDQNATSDQSFQVNVSAGYGVHSENTTGQENRTSIHPNHHDQVSEPTQTVHVFPTPAHHVFEKSATVLDKKFQVGKNHRFREKKVRPRQPELNHNKFEQVNLAPAGTRIVEVLRVPAMYELHLQSDPQRMVTLNNALLSKMMNLQSRRPVRQQMYDFGAIRNNFFQPPSAVMNLVPFNTNNVYQKYAPVAKPKIMSQRVNGAKAVPVQNFGGFKNNYFVTGSESKLNQVVSTPASNEIKDDFYQKPQALHEVPAPVLNKQTLHKTTLPKIRATSVPNLVYGKPVDPPYQPDFWNSNQNNNQGYEYPKPQTVQPQLESHSQGLHYPQPQTANFEIQTKHFQTENLQSQNHQIENVQNQALNLETHAQNFQTRPVYEQQSQFFEEQNSQTEPSYQSGFQNIYHNYKGYQNSQNPYNELIGNNLDHNLMNVNGGLSTYWNADGTMTVSNFHHNPKLYTPSVEGYEVANETPQQDADLHDYGSNISDNDFTAYSSYASEIPVTEPSIEAGDHLNNFGSQTGVEPGYSKQITKRMYPRISRRRIEPLDYILYIKERRFE